MEEGKCTFESTASASSRQELSESQKSSRRSRSSKSIHWQEQQARSLVWVPGETRDPGKRDAHLRPKKRKQAPH